MSGEQLTALKEQLASSLTRQEKLELARFLEMEAAQTTSDATSGSDVDPIEKAEKRAQTGLDRSKRMENIQICVGQNVGRDRERQQQRPIEEFSSRKFGGGNKPRRSNADDAGQYADAKQKNRGINRG